jgi:DNA-binding response OmpR family regulator
MSGAHTPPRILVGDDDIQICNLVRDVLPGTGYDIDLTQNGRDFLEKYKVRTYDLLILDAMLLQMSGLEVVTKLRDRGDGVPIILMSVPPKGADRLEPFAFSYRVDVLRKPFGVDELRTAVNRALKVGKPEV